MANENSQLIEPLEKLVKSNLSLNLLGRSDIKHLKVGFGPITRQGFRGYHIGTDYGNLDFAYSPRTSPLGGSPLADIMTFGELGFTLVTLKSGEIYALHNHHKTMPSGISYESVPRTDYISRLRELCVLMEK